MTAGTLISDVLRKLVVLGSGASPSASQSQDALRELNRMIDSWKLNPLTMVSRLRTTKVLASSTASYTIGSGGSINIVRPDKIEQVAVITDNTAATPNEREIEVFPDYRWAEISQKSLAGGMLHGIFYDRAFSAGLGTVYVYPVPNVSTLTLVLYTSLATTAFADLTMAYTLAPGYEEAFFYNLCVRIAPEYGKRLDPDGIIATMARTSLEAIQAANVRLPILKCDPALLGGQGWFDVKTGRVGNL